MRFFFTKESEILNIGKIRKYDESVFFRGKTFPSLPNWEGAKHGCGSRPSC